MASQRKSGGSERKKRGVSNVKAKAMANKRNGISWRRL